MQSSTDRIKSVIARLQRFISLEEAELQLANMNELISDVAILFKEQTAARDPTAVRFPAGADADVPAATAERCFSSLLSNAINAADGEWADRGLDAAGRSGGGDRDCRTTGAGCRRSRSRISSTRVSRWFREPYRFGELEFV